MDLGRGRAGGQGHLREGTRAGVARAGSVQAGAVRAGSCTVAASGVARQDLGAWSKRYGRVWAARFTGVRAPGRYRVGILGDASAASPWFTIGPAAHLYARPLANALYFFENERDGPDFIHTALRSAWSRPSTSPP